jgi:hypothetical protein
MHPESDPLDLASWSVHLTVGGSSFEQIQFKVIAKQGALTLEEVLAGRGV